jgi:hypothetical protein
LFGLKTETIEMEGRQKNVVSSSIPMFSDLYLNKPNISDVKISAFNGDYYCVMGHGSITLVRSEQEYKLLCLCIKPQLKNGPLSLILRKWQRD